MNEDQREQWRKALAAKAAASRRQRYRPQARGIRSVRGVGMVRVLPRKPSRDKMAQPSPGDGADSRPGPSQQPRQPQPHHPATPGGG